MTRYALLEYGRKIGERSSMEDAKNWRMRNSHRKGKIGKYKNKRICSIRRLK